MCCYEAVCASKEEVVGWRARHGERGESCAKLKVG